jgi:D-3-phosphoglycerate dehydrogenase
MRVVVLSSIWQPVVDQLQQEHDCVLAINPPDPEKMRLLADAEIVILRSPVRLDRKSLQGARKLQLIIRAGSGLDSIDLKSAEAQKIKVVSLPLSADSVAEHTVGLMLALARRIPQLHTSLVAGKWEKHDALGMELKGKTLGLIGFGRIGQRTAELGAAFGMQLISFDRSPHRAEKQTAAQQLGVQFFDIESVFQNADVVTIQTPLNEQTRGLVDRNLLGAMKPCGLLINVGRGGIVDEEALFEALVTHRIGGAALDVFEVEPPIESKLLTLKNFIGTPHVAAQTGEAQQRVGADIRKTIKKWIETSSQPFQLTD